MEEDKKWCIYVHRNKANNKAYIGITYRNPQERWGKNGRCYTKNNQPVFYNAIQKYGWDNFEHIIWEENLTEKEAKEWEIRLIALFRTNCRRYKNPECGYNMTDGGDGCLGRKFSEEAKMKMSELHKNPSEETRRKISEANKNPSEETRMKMSQSQKERFSKLENNPMYGKHHTEESKKKMSEAQKRRFADYKNNPMYGNGRYVVQLSIYGEYIEEYVSAHEAQRITGINETSIRMCCSHKKKYKTAGGYKWMYKDEYVMIIT